MHQIREIGKYHANMLFIGPHDTRDAIILVALPRVELCVLIKPCRKGGIDPYRVEREASMYTESGYLVYIPTGFTQRNLVLFATDEDYWEWIEAQKD